MKFQQNDRPTESLLINSELLCDPQTISSVYQDTYFAVLSIQVTQTRSLPRYQHTIVLRLTNTSDLLTRSSCEIARKNQINDILDIVYYH